MDTSFAQAQGGRWNPPNSFACLYLNEDIPTARLNLHQFIAEWPYEPEDLRGRNGPVLVGATLPQRQQVCNAHTSDGIHALGLPKSYPLDRAGKTIEHAPCQSLGEHIKSLDLRGVRCRSARSANRTHRELAWFSATARSRAKRMKTLAYDDWFWFKSGGSRKQDRGDCALP